MANIHTPKKVLKKGTESWLSKKDKRATQATKITRTGQDTFNVQHDDGSIFECKADLKKVDISKIGGGRLFITGSEIKAKNIMSNEDRRRMGLEPDPELPN